MNQKQLEHMDMAFFPVNILSDRCENPVGLHWAVMVVQVRERCIGYYDSMPTYDTERQFIKMARLSELIDTYLKEKDIPLQEWTRTAVMPPSIPMQTDGCHCALFVCAVIDCISGGHVPRGYNSATMPSYRRCLRQLLCGTRVDRVPPSQRM